MLHELILILRMQNRDANFPVRVNLNFKFFFSNFATIWMPHFSYKSTLGGHIRVVLLKFHRHLEVAALKGYLSIEKSLPHKEYPPDLKIQYSNDKDCPFPSQLIYLQLF